MKKIYFFLVIMAFSHACSFAQMDKTTIAVNSFLSNHDSMIGLMANFNVDLTEHLLISSISFVERFPAHKEGTVVQSYIGPGWRNKNATLAGGPYIGVINHRFTDIKKTELTYGGWMFAQTKNGSWTAWAVWSPSGYFIELWKCLGTLNESKSSKCELQAGMTNLKSNFAITGRMNLPKHNLYAFVGYSFKLYEERHSGEAIRFSQQRHTGLLLEIGYSIQYKKKDGIACEGCR